MRVTRASREQRRYEYIQYLSRLVTKYFYRVLRVERVHARHEVHPCPPGARPRGRSSGRRAETFSQGYSLAGVFYCRGTAVPGSISWRFLLRSSRRWTAIRFLYPRSAPPRSLPPRIRPGDRRSNEFLEKAKGLARGRKLIRLSHTCRRVSDDTYVRM